MLQNVKQKRQEGFTIIEVLIVLAIAGLIMVVVFLAVPALQRNGRNNSLNTDANNVLSAVGEYAANNDGKLPNGLLAAYAAGDGTTTLVDTTVTTENQQTVTLGGNFSSFSVAAGTTTTVSGTSAAGAAQVVKGVKCNGTGITTTGATARSYVIIYAAESSSGNSAVKCVGS